MRAVAVLRLLTVCICVSSALAGCVHTHIGPLNIIQDRHSYNEALATTWKEQTLLNIVKLRYGDVPFFVDVAQIVSGYSQIQSVGTNLSASISPNAEFSVLDPLFAGLTTSQVRGDLPTVSYAPQNSSKFVQNLTLPLPPAVVLYLMQAGYPVDVIFDLMLDSINGLHGDVVTGGQVLPATPEYRRLTQIMRKAQLSGSVGMRIEVSKDKKEEALVMFIRDSDIEPTMAADMEEARRLLRIKPGIKDIRVVFGAAPSGPDEVAMLTRSAYRILQNLSSDVNVPEQHLAEHRAVTISGSAEIERRRFNVICGCKKPADCYASVCYRGHWFWIDDTDLESKRTMIFLSIILALADAGNKENVPFLTISTR